MQGIMETIFDILYLSTVTTLGLLMIQKSTKGSQYRLFGIMAVILGAGDAFHLVPRAYGLLTIGLEANAAALGIGKLITSVTMTIFYVILYHIWRKRYRIIGFTGLTACIYGLAVVRVALCAFPQNDWLSAFAPVSWGIYRNIPFALLGLLIIVLYHQQSKKVREKGFRFMSLAIILSFGFYVPVVLWADAVPAVGVLMIPKTMAYVWIVWMGYSEMKKELKK